MLRSGPRGPQLVVSNMFSSHRTAVVLTALRTTHPFPFQMLPCHYHSQITIHTFHLASYVLMTLGSDFLKNVLVGFRRLEKFL